ncbi:unnamed protein product [Sphagnum troendelagicum]|uniref:Uncharacterized protein n=1 Tax=Sphagnum troendelagicum TaxID=128251 RepID=A0ABP0UM28_9BRYO
MSGGEIGNSSSLWSTYSSSRRCRRCDELGGQQQQQQLRLWPELGVPSTRRRTSRIPHRSPLSSSSNTCCSTTAS